MIKGSLRLCFKKEINAKAATAWEKLVFEDTYKEFFMQAQRIDQEKKFQSFGEMFTHISGAEKLHYLVSTAAINYIRQLGGVIPDLKNALGNTFAPFEDFRFEIIESHISKKELHRVVIYFYSNPFIRIDTIDNALLITKEENRNALLKRETIETELVNLTDNISISHYQLPTTEKDNHLKILDHGSDYSFG